MPSCYIPCLRIEGKDLIKIMDFLIPILFNGSLHHLNEAQIGDGAVQEGSHCHFICSVECKGGSAFSLENGERKVEQGETLVVGSFKVQRELGEVEALDQVSAAFRKGVDDRQCHVRIAQLGIDR